VAVAVEVPQLRQVLAVLVPLVKATLEEACRLLPVALVAVVVRVNQEPTLLRT
jgi:hypothetical protein